MPRPPAPSPSIPECRAKSRSSGRAIPQPPAPPGARRLIRSAAIRPFRASACRLHRPIVIGSCHVPGCSMILFPVGRSPRNARLAEAAHFAGDRGQSAVGGRDRHVRDVRARGVVARVAPRPYRPPDPGPRPRRRGGMSDRGYCYQPDVTVLRNRPTSGTPRRWRRRSACLSPNAFFRPYRRAIFNLAHLTAIQRPPVPGRLRLGERYPLGGGRQGRQPVPAAAVSSWTGMVGRFIAAS